MKSTQLWCCFLLLLSLFWGGGDSRGAKVDDFGRAYNLFGNEVSNITGKMG